MNRLDWLSADAARQPVQYDERSSTPEFKRIRTYVRCQPRNSRANVPRRSQWIERPRASLVLKRQGRREVVRAGDATVQRQCRRLLGPWRLTGSRRGRRAIYGGCRTNAARYHAECGMRGCSLQRCGQSLRKLLVAHGPRQLRSDRPLRAPPVPSQLRPDHSESSWVR